MRSSLASLSCDRLQPLLETYGSPLYIYRRDVLDRTLSRITAAVGYPHTQFHFACVTNGNLDLLKLIQQRCWGLHANTPGDAFLGLKAGFAPDAIVYTGSNLNAIDLRQLLDWGVRRFNLDSISQLQQLGEQYHEFCAPDSLTLGFRLNDPELTGESRIGVRPTEFRDAVAIASDFGLKLQGLHFYRGTGTNATGAFTGAIERVLDRCEQLPDWSYLDFGGGFGYPYQTGAAFNWEEFGGALSAAIKRRNNQRSGQQQPVQLVIEPGRAAIAECGTLVCTVVSVKWQGKKQIIGVDSSIANLTVPSVHGGYREVITSRDAAPKCDIRHPTDICGNTTYSRDYLGKNCTLPRLQIGDTIAFLDCGAYGFSMSSHFLHRPRPAEVLIDDNEHRLIRQREDYSILLHGQI